jgi:hypothetical protein
MLGCCPVHSCGFLLKAAEFRQRSGEVMKQIASRSLHIPLHFAAYGMCSSIIIFVSLLDAVF